MKHFLLTWYGISDLRAALGFEEHGGPILAALRTREYTHVLILAYTDPDKTGPEVLRSQQQAVAAMSGSSAVAGAPKPDRATQTAAVDAFANTAEGHTLFRDWLHGEIKRRDLRVAIRMIPKELAALNGSQGIFHAAAEALDVALAIEGEKAVSLYLSPGTPVMAFTWALVSLMNPELTLRVVVAPDHRQPPVEVQLPYEILDPARRKRRMAGPVQNGGFDTVFHLFGEQRLPTLLGVLQFPANRHVFVTSRKFPADCIRQFLPDTASFEEVNVDPFDPMSTHRAILKATASMAEGERVGFNLTGGTKLMFAGAQTACRRIGGVPFYFEVRDHSLVFLDDFSTMAVRGVENVEQFIQLGGFTVSRRGVWTDNPARERRRALTEALWCERSLVAKIYRDLADANNWDSGPFQIDCPAVSASLDRENRGRVRLRKTEYVVEECPDFAAYLCGGWLEEYVYLLLEPSFREGKLRDLRIGLEVSWKPQAGDVGPVAAQEFDITLTDGRRLVILECKAGRVLNDDIYKLETAVRNHGGVAARGVLIAAFEPGDPAKRRLQNAKSLSWLCGDWVATHLVAEILEGLGVEAAKA